MFAFSTSTLSAKFFWEHPEEVDLRKVDPLWFQWLISNGKTRMAAAPKEHVSKRTEAYMPELSREHRNFRKKGPAWKEQAT